MANIQEKLLTVRVETAKYAISIEWVREILTLDNIAPMPSNIDFIRGMLMVRGNPIPLLDIRKYFKKSTLKDERLKLVELLSDKQQNHIDWINELSNCITEKREFTKALDPTKCAFGKWYQNYKADTPDIEREFQALEAPHIEIHKIGQEILELSSQGNINKAKARLSDAKEFELKKLISVFEHIKDYLISSIRETAIIVGKDNNYCGLIVDSVNDIRARSSFKEENFGITGIQKGVLYSLTDNQEPIHVLNISEIMTQVNMKSQFSSSENVSAA